MHEFHLVCPNSGLFDYSKNEICEKCLNQNVKTGSFLKKCDRRGGIYSFLKGMRSFISNNIIRHNGLLDVIISPSDFLKDKLIEGGISGRKITVLRNPIISDISCYDTRKENVICFFGRFSREKNLSFLINAFSEWKRREKNDFKLWLIGKGDDESNLRSIVNKCYYKNDIIFKPFMPADKLNIEIQCVKYYAMTSNWYENAPMGILEAASLNIISIVPDIGGMKETVEKVVKAGGIYKEDDIDSWCETINYLETNYESESRILDMNFKDIVEKYGIDNYYKQLYKIYLDT